MVHYGKKGYIIKKKSQPYTPKPKPTISVFNYFPVSIELYMDDEMVRRHDVRKKAEKILLLNEWEGLMSNLYHKRVFYITITKKQKK